MASSSNKRPLPLRLFDAGAHLLVLIAFGVALLFLRVTALFFFPFHRCSWTPRVIQFLFRRGLAGLWAVFDLTGLIRIAYRGEEIQAGPVVLVANHPSLIDALALLPHLPRTACLYKATLEQSLFPRQLAEYAGFISNAGGMQSIRAATDRLRRGWRVLAFPEGTRTTTPPMGPWKSSYALMAARAKVPVQPIYIAVDHPIFAKNAPWWRPTRFPVRISITFGQPVPPPDQQSVRRFHRELEAAFRRELMHNSHGPTE